MKDITSALDHWKPKEYLKGKVAPSSPDAQDIFLSICYWYYLR